MISFKQYLIENIISFKSNEQYDNDARSLMKSELDKIVVGHVGTNSSDPQWISKSYKSVKELGRYVNVPISYNYNDGGIQIYFKQGQVDIVVRAFANTKLPPIEQRQHVLTTINFINDLRDKLPKIFGNFAKSINLSINWIIVKFSIVLSDNWIKQYDVTVKPSLPNIVHEILNQRNLPALTNLS